MLLCGLIALSLYFLYQRYTIFVSGLESQAQAQVETNQRMINAKSRRSPGDFERALQRRKTLEYEAKRISGEEPGG